MLPSTIIVNLVLAAAASAIGEFTILHHPQSLSFKGHDVIKQSTLREVFSASVGFSAKSSKFDGLYIEDPFNLAKAIATVAVDGVTDIDYGKGHQFPLKNDEDESEVYSELRHRILERFPDSEDSLIRIDLSNGLSDLEQSRLLGEHVKEIQRELEDYETSLKPSVPEDHQFLQEINILSQTTHLLNKYAPKASNFPTLYWFRVSSLAPLVNLHGNNSTQVNDAKLLLKETIFDLTRTLEKIYKGQVLISVINNEPDHVRRGRSILEAKVEPTPKAGNELNLSKHYTADYPVIFNIILWFGVAMVFSLLAICIAIGTMDPGRDSIIYRMTSTRLKKDN